MQQSTDVRKQSTTSGMRRSLSAGSATTAFPTPAPLTARTSSLSNYLTLKGQQAKKGTEKDAKSLAEQVKVYWTETEDSANQAYGSVKDWIFDSYVPVPVSHHLYNG